MNEETTFWKGSPSQWLNIGPFSLAILLSAGIVAGGIFFPPAFIGLMLPAIYALWSYLTVRCQTFELTTERLRITKGVINQNIDEVELYRVKDMVVERKWWMRLTGLGNIHLETSDRSLPHVDIPAISGCLELREDLRRKVEAMRDKKRVREMDFDETASDGAFDDMGDMI
ncbi:PH domain-containing protein [Luteolibacter algae]|uniref:PH domain-containing protein n=1 Tax=Luteolibacter algae TaxID=454151 RepID=A0ABW5DAQ7_9BACT